MARYEKPGDEELRRRLTPLQYEVTQRAGTEPAFDNKYWDEHRDGIYVDVVFNAEPAILVEVERVLKITDGVLRFKTVRPKAEVSKPA